MNDNSFWFCALLAATLFSEYSETLYFKFLYYNPLMHNSEKWLKYVYPFFNIWQWLVLITDFYCQCESFNGQYLEFVEKKSWLFAINRFLIGCTTVLDFYLGCSWWSLKKVKHKVLRKNLRSEALVCFIILWFPALCNREVWTALCLV